MKKKEMSLEEAAAASTKEAKEATAMAEEALTKTLVKKIIHSWEFIAFLLIIVLASIFSAISISLGLNLLGG